MKEFTHINDFFRSVADIEVETPITLGATTAGAAKRWLGPQLIEPSNWDKWAKSFPLKDMRRLKFSLEASAPDADAVLGFFAVPSPERWHSLWQSNSIAL